MLKAQDGWMISGLTIYPIIHPDGEVIFGFQPEVFLVPNGCNCLQGLQSLIKSFAFRTSEIGYFRSI